MEFVQPATLLENEICHIKFLQFRSYWILWHTCIKHSVSVNRWGPLDSPGKCQILKNFSRLDLGVSFPPRIQQNPPGMIWKSSQMNWQIYCADLKIYLPDWPKNTTMVVNLQASRKAYEILHTNHQMNNVFKNQIYLTESQHISLGWLFHMIARNDSLTVTNTRIVTTIQHEKRKDMRNN